MIHIKFRRSLLFASHATAAKIKVSGTTVFLAGQRLTTLPYYCSQRAQTALMLQPDNSNGSHTAVRRRSFVYANEPSSIPAVTMMIQ